MLSNMATPIKIMALSKITLLIHPLRITPSNINWEGEVSKDRVKGSS